MHTAAELTKFIKAHGVHVRSFAERDADDLADAQVQLPCDLFVQICDYPMSDGGLHYVLNRYIFKDGHIDGCTELGTFVGRFELLKKILVELA